MGDSRKVLYLDTQSEHFYDLACTRRCVACFCVKSKKSTKKAALWAFKNYALCFFSALVFIYNFHINTSHNNNPINILRKYNTLKLMPRFYYVVTSTLNHLLIGIFACNVYSSC